MADESRNLSAIVLAAGQGTRMRSARPKPIHHLCGRPLVGHAVDALSDAAPSRVIVVVGHGAQAVIEELSVNPLVPIEFVEQMQQNGTGDAVRVALGVLDPDVDGDVVVVPGDAPLLRPETVARLVAIHRASSAAATMLTTRMADPTGYGRVLRDADGGVIGVIEQADASDEQRRIDEVNTSMYCFDRQRLTIALSRIDTDNAQGEMYLTDVVGKLVDDGCAVGTFEVDDETEVQGVNDRVQLAHATAVLRARINEGWMRAGVTMVDPAATYVDATVRLERDVTLLPGTILEGTTVVAAGSVVGPDTRLTDTTVGSFASIAETTTTKCRIGRGACVGPYVVLCPGSIVDDDEHVGPFVRVASETPPGQQ